VDPQRREGRDRGWDVYCGFSEDVTTSSSLSPDRVGEGKAVWCYGITRTRGWTWYHKLVTHGKYKLFYALSPHEIVRVNLSDCSFLIFLINVIVESGNVISCSGAIIIYYDSGHQQRRKVNISSKNNKRNHN